MRLHYWIGFFVIAVYCIPGCSSGTGKDTIANIDPPSRQTQSTSTCLICHASLDMPAINPLISNGSGTSGKHIKHVSERGIACEFCHDNYMSKPTHMNGVLDAGNPAVTIVLFSATNPTGTWTNDTGPGTGTCSSLSCHGSDSVDWYSAAGWTLPTCSACHSTARGPRRTVLGSSGDFGVNPANISHHVAGSTDPTPAQCLTCHDRYQHMTGTIYLKSVDTPSGNMAYDPSRPSTLEPFCLGCHDADGASGNKNPFADGRTLGVVPNMAGDKIAGYWNASYTVHKNNGLTCAGTGSPNTGCHGNNQTINMHGSASKGLLTRNLTLPVPASSDFNYAYYKLCFDCHDNYPAVTKEVVLGYKQGGHYDVAWAPTPYYTAGIQSLFRDRYISNPANYPAYWAGVNQTYNDGTWGYDPYTPLHNYHLSKYDFFYNGWAYRGTEIGQLSCVTCHNVHGTQGTVRSTYDEFGIRAYSRVFGGGETDYYKQLSDYSDATFMSYPINCNFNCHSITPGTSYWHSPADE